MATSFTAVFFASTAGLFPLESRRRRSGRSRTCTPDTATLGRLCFGTDVPSWAAFCGCAELLPFCAGFAPFTLDIAASPFARGGVLVPESFAFTLPARRAAFSAFASCFFWIAVSSVGAAGICPLGVGAGCEVCALAGFASAMSRCCGKGGVDLRIQPGVVEVETTSKMLLNCGVSEGSYGVVFG